MLLVLFATAIMAAELLTLLVFEAAGASTDLRPCSSERKWLVLTLTSQLLLSFSLRVDVCDLRFFMYREVLAVFPGALD